MSKNRSESNVMKVGEEPAPLASTGKPNKLAPAESRHKTKAGNRFAVLNAFSDFTMRQLSRAEQGVWLLLWRDTKRDGLVRTAQADLARRAGTTTRTVERSIKSLERRGLLTVVHRGGLRSGVSTYRVHALTKESLPTAAQP